MRLARHRFEDGTRGVVLVEGEWVALSAVLPGVGTVREALRERRRLQEALAGLSLAAVPAGERVPEAEARLETPLELGGTIWAIGLNYRDHAEESGLQLPPQPLLFGKNAGALAGPFDPVVLPTDLGVEFDYEVELAVVIGDELRDVDVTRAMDGVAGYAVADDLSTRDLQFADGQWIRSKSFDGFCPIGPWITVGEIDDPHGLGIRCWVNGEPRQSSSTGQLVYRVPELVAFLSRSMTLRPGDVILTGTPPGVAMGREDRPWLRPGDVVRCEIDGLGAIENPMTEDPARQGLRWRLADPGAGENVGHGQ